MSFGKLDFFDESDNDGSGSGSPGTSVGSAGESVGSVSGVGFGDFFQLELNHLVTLFRWLCSYQEELSPKVVNS